MKLVVRSSNSCKKELLETEYKFPKPATTLLFKAAQANNGGK